MRLAFPTAFLLTIGNQEKRFIRCILTMSHPLSRLIEFSSGIPVGAIVTDKLEDVVNIVDRVLTNDMEYKLEQGKPGHFQLKEKTTNSIVRLQTADLLLR